MELITGHKGENHITADDDASKFAALIGKGEYVLDKGNKFKCTNDGYNEVVILDGDAIFQGRHCRIRLDERESRVIEAGSQGEWRNDLICIKYTRNGDIESAEIDVVKGTPGLTAETAEDPEYTIGSIEDGATEHYMPLYRVIVEGISIKDIVPVYKLYHRIPNFSSGTDNPSGGEDGDVYFKIIE